MMETQNILRTHGENWSFRRTNIQFVTALDPIQCLGQIKYQRLLLKCAPISELPSNISGFRQVGAASTALQTKVGKPQKKLILQWPGHSGLTPNPSSLVATFFCGFVRDSKKVIFLSGQALTPLLLPS